MTIETVQAGLRYWGARARASLGGRHLTLCYEAVAGLRERLGRLRVKVQEAPGAPEQQALGQDIAEEEAIFAAWLGIPEQPLNGEEAEQPLDERVRVAAIEAGRKGAAEAMKIMDTIHEAHEYEVRLEAEALQRECAARSFDHRTVGVGPRLEYILELIARLRVGAVAALEIKLTDAEPEEQEKQDPILAFLIYMEGWLESGDAADLDVVQNMLDAAKEKVRQGLQEQLKEHETELEEQLEPTARDAQTPYPGSCEAEVELTRLASYMAETYPHEMRPGEPLVGMVTRLLYCWGSNPKGRDVEAPCQRSYEAGELIRLETEMVCRYNYELHGSETAVDMALRLLHEWGSKPKQTPVVYPFGIVNAARVFLESVVDEWNIQHRRDFTNPLVQDLFDELAARDMAPSLVRIRGTRPTKVIMDDVTEPETPEALGAAAFHTKQQPYPDPRRHEKFAGCSVERCPVEPEAAPMEIQDALNATLNARTPEEFREAQAVWEKVAAFDYEPEPDTFEEMRAEELEEMRAENKAEDKAPNRCEQVERLNSRSVRDEAGRVYVRHLTVPEAEVEYPDPREVSVEDRLTVLANQLEAVESMLEYRATTAGALLQLRNARGELNTLKGILLA